MRLLCTRLLVAMALLLMSACLRTTGIPSASPDADTRVTLQSNQDNTVFYVDGRKVGVGRIVDVLVSDADHRVSAKPVGYVEKVEFIRPPYDDRPFRFTFLIEDQERHAAGAAPAAAPVAAAPQSAAPAPEATPKGVPRIWVVAVGISSYADSQIALAYAARDATAVSQFFASARGGSVPPDRNVLLVDGEATRAKILGALTRVAGRTAPEDLLVVYLALHGIPDSGGDLYFLAQDTGPRELVGTGLPQRDIEYALSKAGAKRVVMIADACHSGAAGFGGYKTSARGLQLAETNRLIESLAQARPGLAVISAASSTESSLEGEKWGHGVFTFHLLRGLAGGADEDKDGLVSIRELYEFTYKQVSEDTGGQQHPELKGTFDNRLPVSSSR